MIAVKKEFAVIEKDDRWELYNMITGIIKETVWKSENQYYGVAIIDKWGFDEVEPPEEIDDYDDLIPDYDAMFYTEDEAKQAKALAQAEYLQQHVGEMAPDERKELKKSMEKRLNNDK